MLFGDILSFTEEKFILLDKSRRLKKIIYTVLEHLNGKKNFNYLKDLIKWLNKYENYDFNVPEDKNEWDKILIELKALLYKENIYIEKSPFDDKNINRKILPFSLILEDIRSPFNVGSILRNAEAFGVEKIFLCGITPNPELNKKVLKTSRDVDIKNEYIQDGKDIVLFLKKNKYKIYALEKTSNSKNINNVNFTKPLALILGNEEFGISKDLLDISDEIVHINMLGSKNSLNVSVASGIALFKIINSLL